MSEDRKQPEQDDPPYISIPMLTRERLLEITDPNYKSPPERQEKWEKFRRKWEEELEQRRKELEAQRSSEEK